MKAIDRPLRIIAEALSLLSTAIVACMMLLVVADVILRAFFNAPITGSTEITQMLLVGMILGFAKSCLGGDNLKVDFVANFLPKKVQYVLDVFTSVLCIAVSVLLAWRTYVAAMYNKTHNIVFVTLTNVPKWLFMMLLALGFCGAVIGFILRINKLNNERSEYLAGEDGSPKALEEKEMNGDVD